MRDWALPVAGCSQACGDEPLGWILYCQPAQPTRPQRQAADVHSAALLACTSSIVNLWQLYLKRHSLVRRISTICRSRTAAAGIHM